MSNNTSITAFSSVMLLHSNTPNQKGSTRAQIAQFGDKFLMTDDPSSPLYYKFNFYRIPTDFEYVGVQDDVGQLVDRQQDLHDAVLQQAELQRPDVDHRDERDRQVEQLPEDRATACRFSTCRDFGVFRTGMWSEYARPIATRRHPIRARGWMPRCRTSTRSSGRRRCSRTRNTRCA